MEESQTPPKKPGFWKRMSAGQPTRKQIIFDVIVGAIVPILLLVFDPIVFRGGLGSCIGTAFLGQYQLLAYLAIGMGVITLLIWLTMGQRIDGFYAAIAAGILLSGGFSALGLAIMLFPISTIGLFILFIGALGYIPFLTAIAYLRNGVRALRHAHEAQPRKLVVAGLMLGGALLVFGPAAYAQQQLTQIVDVSSERIAWGTSDDDPAAVEQLRYLNLVCLGLCRDTIAAGLTSKMSIGSQDSPRVARAYRVILGEEHPSNGSCYSSSAD
jgi:hypothetical protein